MPPNTLRVGNANLLGKPVLPIPKDELWDKWLTVEIGPHPGLSPSQKLAIERDYAMENGRYSTQVRAALLSYFLLSMRIGDDDLERKAICQQIILLNRDELRPYIVFG